jgi:hypothetical protein
MEWTDPVGQFTMRIASNGSIGTVRIGGAIQQPAPNAGNPADADDPGTPVEMFENPNLDRYLRNAQGFLDRQNYEAAMQRMANLIATALVRQKRRYATKPTRGSQRRRVDEKRHRGDIKRGRQDGSHD